MSIGPTLIFDKSALQGLSADESMWLESFYMSNITSLFFVETLADLEKEVHAGKTPEEVVGHIAHKTPEMGCVNVHHRDLIAGELMGRQKVEMSGRPIIGGGRTVELEGKNGVIFQESPEIEASKRWAEGKFLEIERNIAKGWRQELASMGQEDLSVFEKLFATTGAPKTFEELKKTVDTMVGGIKRESIF